jgi:hypothetical protein
MKKLVSIAIFGAVMNCAPVFASELCPIQDVEIPANAKIIAAGSYSGAETPFQIDQSGHQATSMAVSVNEAKAPVFLLLGAYEPTVWDISKTKDTNIVGVYLSGYHKQVVTGLSKSIPVMDGSREAQSDCRYFYVSAEKERQVSDFSKLIFKRDVSDIYLANHGKVAIGTPAAPESYIRESAPGIESVIDLKAPKAGQEGVDDAVAAGILRKATSQDLEDWANLVEPQDELQAKVHGDTHQTSRSHGFMGFHSYVAMKPFVFPNGLYGANSITVFVMKGVPLPTGNPGHSTVYDFNTKKCAYGTECHINRFDE